MGRGTRLSIATDIDEAVRVIVPHVLTAGSGSAGQLKKDLLQTIDAVAAAMPRSERASE